MYRHRTGRVLVRDYRLDDRDAVRRICFETGMQGQSIAPQYGDFESFADIFTAYYTDHEPHNAIVAEWNGRVVGYTLAARDSRKVQGRWRYMLHHALLRGVLFRPGTARFYRRSVIDRVVDLASSARRPTVDLDRYPSHPHVNLLPVARASGVATRMFCHLFDRLVQQGSSGIYGEISRSNHAIMAWGHKVGFTELGEPYPVPGVRDATGERVQLQLMVRDLSTWEPGAWKHETNAD